MFNVKKICLFLLIFIFSFSCYADQSFFSWLHNYTFSIGVGHASYTSNTQNISIPVTAFETDTLSQLSHDTTPTLYLTIKKVIPLNISLIPSIALGPAIYLQHVTYQGEIFQFGSPILNNYTYQLTNKVRSLFLEGQIQFKAIVHRIMPIVVLGIGQSAINIAYDESPNLGIPGGEAHLTPITKYHFAYEAGVGAMFKVTTHIFVSLLFNYQHLGQVDSGTAGSRGLLQPLRLNTIVHHYLFSVTAKF